MATTTNYAWTTPDNSGLVKNGAQDIRTLGSAVDTSLWNVGFGQAGKNKIINGNFGVWQRGTGAFTGNVYSADRWTFYGQGSGTSHSATQQTFTTGTAPDAGYEGTFFYRDVIASGSDAATQMILIQKIEDVRALAGQTVTVSFWAKANTGTPKIGIEFYQDFGSGGSGAVSGTGQSVTISTAWARYSATLTVPSISGKTIGTGSSLFLNLWLSAGSSSATRSGSIGLQSATFDIWGVQVEAGSVATPFQTASGSIQGELALCQRYYFRYTTTQLYATLGMGANTTTAQARINLPFPISMRIAPTAIDYSTLALAEPFGSVIAATSVTLDGATPNTGNILVNVASGLNQYRPNFLYTNNSTSAYLGFTAEL